MSDNWLQFVPKNPAFRPTVEAAAKAKALLSSFVSESESVESAFQEGITFFHPGANWSGVLCPACGADAEPWWNEAMDKAATANFTMLECTTPCCSSPVSLNELRYLWPAGFGSYVLEAMNPNVKCLAPSQLAQLQAALGCELREIPVHI